MNQPDKAERVIAYLKSQYRQALAIGDIERFVAVAHAAELYNAAQLVDPRECPSYPIGLP